MGTSATIQVDRSGESISLSQPNDGYPIFVLPNLASWIVSVAENQKLSLSHGIERLKQLHINSYNLSGIDSHGRGLTVNKKADPLDWAYAFQKMTPPNWAYHVDLDMKNIEVSCATNDHDRHDKQLLADPSGLLAALEKSAVSRGEESLRDSLRDLMIAGFTINGHSKSHNSCTK
jgi:hypothetical protein